LLFTLNPARPQLTFLIVFDLVNFISDLRLASQITRCVSSFVCHLFLHLSHLYSLRNTKQLPAHITLCHDDHDTKKSILNPFFQYRDHHKQTTGMIHHIYLNNLQLSYYILTIEHIYFLCFDPLLLVYCRKVYFLFHFFAFFSTNKKEKNLFTVLDNKR
jgi:hypothetical protein